MSDRPSPISVKLARRAQGFADYWLAYGWPDFCRPLEDDDVECF